MTADLARAHARVRGRLGRLRPQPADPPPAAPRASTRRRCRRGEEEIRAGEAFQIVVSQRFEVDTTADALDVYRVLRLTNPSPYMYLLGCDRAFDIVGSSPEALVTVNGRHARSPTRSPAPSRGARRRPRTPRWRPSCWPTRRSGPSTSCWSTSAATTSAGSAEPGTVEVVEFMDVRRYSHIMHLESTVTGRLAAGRDRARRAARRLPGRHAVRRAEARGRWRSSTSSRCPGAASTAGCVGYLDFAGDADTAIAIRTALLRDGAAYVQAGGGIVADSDPPTEDQESRNKAAAVVRAISVAQSFQRLTG